MFVVLLSLIWFCCLLQQDISGEDIILSLNTVCKQNYERWFLFCTKQFAVEKKEILFTSLQGPHINLNLQNLQMWRSIFEWTEQMPCTCNMNAQTISFSLNTFFKCKSAASLICCWTSQTSYIMNFESARVHSLLGKTLLFQKCLWCVYPCWWIVRFWFCSMKM